jgi:glycosyltransferase involved in cell wall biosynthesis
MQVKWVSELHTAGFNAAGFAADVAVVIPTYNHARFLGEAIESVLAQTHQANEIIVVDDGSTDDPAAVVVQFPTVRLIRQENRGLSAARNTGLSNCKANYVVFLDADDRLLPSALESGLAYIATRPDCAFVYGGHRRVSDDGIPLEADIINQLEGDAHLAFARKNPVGPPATALYRHDCLMAVNGFDESLRCCQDHDLYLRLARRYPIASHAAIVAEYRKHGEAMSNDHLGMLKEVLVVLERDEGRSTTDAQRVALRDGRAYYRSLYASRMLHVAAVEWRARHNSMILIRSLIEATRWAPSFTVRKLLGGLRRRAGKVLGQRQAC